MSNRRALAKATKESRQPKPVAKPKDIILDPAGQWKFPGQPTRIPSNEITMDSVNYPVWAVPNVGQPTMMQPGSYYTFPNADYVDEYPQMAEGGMAEPMMDENGEPTCPDGYTYNSSTGYCEKSSIGCPEGFEVDPATGKCIEGECKPGYVKNQVGNCVPDINALKEMYPIEGYSEWENDKGEKGKTEIRAQEFTDKASQTCPPNHFYDQYEGKCVRYYTKEEVAGWTKLPEELSDPKDNNGWLEALSNQWINLYGDYWNPISDKHLTGWVPSKNYQDSRISNRIPKPAEKILTQQVAKTERQIPEYEQPQLELKENKLPGFVYRSPEQDRRWIDYTKPTPFKKGKEYGHIPWSPYSAALRLLTGYDKGDSEKQLKEEIESAKEEGRPINFKGIPLMGKSDLKQRRSYKNALENYYESEKKFEEQNQKKQEDYEKAMIEYNNYMLEEEAKRKASGLESDKYGGSTLEYKRGGSNSKRFSRSLEATNRFFAENKLFKKPKKLSKKRIYDPAAKYYQAGGVTLPEDYSQFESFAKTLPTNLQDPNFEYGNPDQYDLYGMWETVGKPQTFQEVQDSDYFPLQDDGEYHGFTVGSDGIFLKPMSHGTTWKEVMNSQLNMDPFFQQNRIIKNEQGRLQYVPNKEDDYIELDLSPEEIEQYKKGGYIVEEVNDPSIPILTKAAKGGEQGCPPGQYWDGVKCTRLITLKNDKKYIDGVANWAMHVDNNDVRKGITSAYNDQIKNYLYSGNYGFDPESGSLIKLSKVQPKSVTTLDVKTKASREKEKLAEQHHYAEEENKKAYEKSITDAGFDPATFGKAKGINTITGEPIYASSKEEAERKNQEAINQAAIEGHAAVVNNPVFQAASYFTPWGMAIGAMRGAARLAPDTYNFAKDPSWSGAGQLGMDLAEISPFAKPIASAVKTGVQNTYKINPWAFKPDQSQFYRQIGKTGLDDALSSNVIRSADQTTFPRPYFVEGKDFKMLEQTGSGAHGRPSVIFETSGVTNEGIPFVSPANANAGYTPWIANMSEVPLTEGRLLKQNWLKGYKEVPKQLPGSPNAHAKLELQKFYESHPELSKIGNPKQYSKYLNTIFPESKIKDIMFHQTFAKNFDTFKNSNLGATYLSFFNVPTGGVFAPLVKKAGSRTLLTKVNVNNPFIINRYNYPKIKKATGLATQNVEKLKKKFDLSKHDAVLGYPNPRFDKGELDAFPNINFIKGRRGDLIELAVMDPKNTHILGSKPDIEGFSQFVKTQNPVSNALKQFFNRPPGPMMLLGSSGSGNMIKKNMNYYKQLLDSYDAKKMSSANRKFYNDLIETGKKQDGMVTEAQLRELDRLKTGNFDFGKRGYAKGGVTNDYMEMDIPQDQVQWYIDNGYDVEILD
jgi:hypothetical protein